MFPILKRLALKCCKGMTHLNIGCPELEDLEVEDTKINGLDISGGERLKTLRVICSFRALKNESWVKIFAPKLETFCWEHNEIPEKYSVQSFPFLKNCCIEITFKYRFTINAAINFLSGVVSARYLRIHILHAVKILSTIYFEGGLPFPFLNLRTLEVRTGRLSKIEIPAIVCLFKNAPLLNTLKLEISYSLSSTGSNKKWGITLLDNSGCTEEQFWESEAQALRSFLDHLRVLRIHVHFSMSESMIIATRFLLKHGNALQEVTLRSNPHEWKEEFIIGFPWASPHIKISID